MIKKYGHGKVMTILLSIYAMTTLISMAPMSIAAVTLVIGVVFFLKYSTGYEFLEQLNSLISIGAVKRYLFLTMLLVGAIFLSLWIAAVYPLSFGGKSAEVSFLKDIAKLWYLFWPFLIAVALKSIDIRQRKIVLTFWLSAFGLLSVVGIYQHFTGWPRPQVFPWDLTRFHTTLFLGHHLSVASIFIFPFFLSLAWAKSRGANKLIWILCGVGLLSLFYTYSRLLWISLPIGMLVWFLWNKSFKTKLVIVLMTIGLAAASTQLPPIKERLQRTEFGVGYRIKIWEANWEFIKARPITGVGFRKPHELSRIWLTHYDPGSTRLFSGHAHSNFLEMLSSTGLIGLLTWMLYSLGIFGLLLPTLKAGFFQKSDTYPTIFPKALFSAWIVFHLNGVTQVNFWEGKVSHQMMWAVAWSMVWLSEIKTNRTKPV